MNISEAIQKTGDLVPQAKLDSSSAIGYRTDFGARDIQVNWKKIDLAWILKRKQSEHFRLSVNVNVWDKEHEGCNRALHQDFTGVPVTMEDWKHARLYAKSAIEMGALLAVVDLRVHMPPRFHGDDGDHLAVSESYVPLQKDSQ